MRNFLEGPLPFPGRKRKIIGSKSGWKPRKPREMLGNGPPERRRDGIRRGSKKAGESPLFVNLGQFWIRNMETNVRK